MTTEEERITWFHTYIDRVNAAGNAQHRQDEFGSFLCPRCGYPTLDERGSYLICPLCRWEDDGQDDPHANEIWGGPNGDYSLAEARRNFAEHGIMYRSSNRACFPQNPEMLRLKRALIEVYERRRVAATNEQRQALEAEEYALRNKMVITPQRIMPLP